MYDIRTSLNGYSSNDLYVNPVSIVSLGYCIDFYTVLNSRFIARCAQGTVR